MNKPTFQGKELHISNVKNLKDSRNLDFDISKPCPMCGKNLTIRKGKYGNFIVCSNYPYCKYIDDKKNLIFTEQNCPLCGNLIEVKYTRKGLPFYGCSNYPDCKYATSITDNKIIEQYKEIRDKNVQESTIIKERAIESQNTKKNKIKELSGNYSKQFKKGKREDLDIEFNSSWEANFARILKYLKIDFNYETDAYKLKRDVSNKYASYAYIPDFFLKNGTIIEIKGNYDLRSLENTKLFLKQFPNEKLVVIDSDLYYIFSKYYSLKIDKWEKDNVAISSTIIPVVGITYGERKKHISCLNIGDELFIEREYNNQFDKNAIKVLDRNNNQIGYISADYTMIFAPKIELGIKYKIVLKEISDKFLKVSIKATNLDDIELSQIINLLK